MYSEHKPMDTKKNWLYHFDMVNNMNATQLLLLLLLFLLGRRNWIYVWITTYIAWLLFQLFQRKNNQMSEPLQICCTYSAYVIDCCHENCVYLIIHAISTFLASQVPLLCLRRAVTSIELWAEWLRWVGRTPTASLLSCHEICYIIIN